MTQSVSGGVWYDSKYIWWSVVWLKVYQVECGMTQSISGRVWYVLSIYYRVV